MRGPFRVIFLDYFGFKHEYVIFAQSSNEAINRLYELYLYPIKEVIDVYLDIDDMLHNKNVALSQYTFLEGEI